MQHILERVSGVARFDPPPAISREVGRIIVRWAYFEHILSDMIWQIMGIRPAQGRIAVRDPGAPDRLSLLRELMLERAAAWDSDLYKSVLRQAKLSLSKRNMLAHGIWDKYGQTGAWQVQFARGAWPESVRDIIQGSKKVTPESVVLTAADLRKVTLEIEQLISDLKQLRSSAVGPSQP
jgi:hypothetical protein